MAWATPRTWTTGDVATAAQFNQDMRDNLQYLWGGDGVTLGSGPQYVYGEGSKAAQAVAAYGTINFSFIYSTTYSVPASGVDMPVTEAGIYILSAYTQASPLTSIGGVTGTRVHLNGTALQGLNTGWHSPFNVTPISEAKRLIKLAAAGTLNLLAISFMNSATTDMFGRMQAARVA